MNVFIIGAGFTKGLFPDAPLNADLIDALEKRYARSAVGTLRLRYGTSDIEIALTKLDVDIAQTATAADVALRQRAEKELGDYFAGFTVSPDLLSRTPWLTELIDQAFAPDDVAISLNYDCAFEGALDCRVKWSPRGGYGYSLDNPLVADDKFPVSPVTVLKIHGSASFVIAPYVDKPGSNAVNFVINEQFFPISGKGKNFRFGAGNARTYLIAPSYVKVPTLSIAYLMHDALSAVAKAENLIIIGTALRPEDSFLTVLLTKFLRHPSWKDRRILVVDPNASGIVARLKAFWGVNVSDQVLAISKPLQSAVDELVTVLRR